MIKTIRLVLRIIIVIIGYIICNKATFFISGNSDPVTWDGVERFFYVLFLGISMFASWRITYEYELWNSSDWFEDLSDWIEELIKKLKTK